jgi:hypothetical protein
VRPGQRIPVAVPGAWADQAACHKQTLLMVMPDLEQYATRSKKDTIRLMEAVTLCEACPVLDECRAWALTSPDPAFGMVAGGYTPEQRGKVRQGA